MWTAIILFIIVLIVFGIPFFIYFGNDMFDDFINKF